MSPKLTDMLNQVALEKSIDVSEIPEYARNGIGMFSDLYHTLKKECEGVDGLSLHNALKQHALGSMLSPIGYALPNNYTTRMLVTQKLIEDGNRPIAKSKLYHVAGEFWPAFEWRLYDDGTVLDLDHEKECEFIDGVRTNSGNTPFLILLGEKSNSGLKEFGERFPLNTITSVCSDYLNNRIDAYTKRSGVPKPGHKKRVDILRNVSRTFF